MIISMIIGQEAVWPDGLGRVIDYDRDDCKWVQVATYFKDRQCKWDPSNIELVKLKYQGGN